MFVLFFAREDRAPTCAGGRLPVRSPPFGTLLYRTVDHRHFREIVACSKIHPLDQCQIIAEPRGFASLDLRRNRSLRLSMSAFVIGLKRRRSIPNSGRRKPKARVRAPDHKRPSALIPKACCCVSDLTRGSEDRPAKERAIEFLSAHAHLRRQRVSIYTESTGSDGHPPPIDVVANTCDIAGTVGTQEDKAATKRFS